MKLIILAGLLLIALPLAFIKPKLKQYKVQKEGVLVSMRIAKLPVSCIGTKSNHFATFDYNGELFLKKIPAFYCEEHRIDEVVLMKYLLGSGIALFPGETVGKEFIAIAILEIFGLFCVVKGIRSTIKS